MTRGLQPGQGCAGRARRANARPGRPGQPPPLVEGLDQARGRAVVLGVRPEDVHLSGTRTSGALAGKVFIEEPLGAEVLVTLGLGGALVKARAGAGFQVARGQPLFVTFAEDRLHLFAADDGQALRG